MIVTKTTALGGATRDERRRQPLTLDDARAVAERSPSVEHVSAYLFPPNGIHSARYKGNDVYNIQMAGTEEAYAFGGTTMKYGRFFTDQESQHHMPDRRDRRGYGQTAPSQSGSGRPVDRRR